MAGKILSIFALILSLFILPWWLFIVVLALVIFFGRMYVVPVIFALVYDLIYGMPTTGFYFYKMFFITLVLALGIYFLRRQLFRYNEIS